MKTELKELRITNLATSVSDKELTQLFETYGTVERVQMKTVESGIRTASLVMDSPKAALKACEQLNGYRLDDRPMLVSPAPRV